MAYDLGVGSMDLEKAVITQQNHCTQTDFSVNPGEKVRRLERYMDSRDACSACHSALVRALSRLEPKERDALEQKICVGQVFKEQAGGWGAGNCTRNFARSVPGCPPQALDIVEQLREFAKRAL